MALALAGAGFAAVDVVAGLTVDGGYTVGLAYLHLGVVAAGVVGVVLGAWRELRGGQRGLGLLLASSALLLGAQAPWSLAGLGGRPWFALVGVAAAVLLASAVVLASGWSPAPVAVPAWLPRRLPQRHPGRTPRGAAGRAGAGPSAPGWYPDPEADAAPCWRWWDGRGWTEHRSPGAAS